MAILAQARIFRRGLPPLGFFFPGCKWGAWPRALRACCDGSPSIGSRSRCLPRPRGGARLGGRLGDGVDGSRGSYRPGGERDDHRLAPGFSHQGGGGRGARPARGHRPVPPAAPVVEKASFYLHVRAVRVRFGLPPLCHRWRRITCSPARQLGRARVERSNREAAAFYVSWEGEGGLHQLPGRVVRSGRVRKTSLGSAKCGRR